MKNTKHLPLQISRRRLALALLATCAAFTTHPVQAQSDLSSGAVFSRGPSFEQRDGKSLYENICQGCHMPDAKGAVGAGHYPALAGNTNLATPLYPAAIVLKGLRSMPAFSDELDDEQIAQVVNYVRSHFGNKYKDTITAAKVKSLRPAK
ncbi:MAG: cytochrome c [Nevskia sp.]|nr:cytochrome c [Nevskia sp.]